MAEVNIHEAKTHLSRLLRRVEGGEEIVIARDGAPVARLVPARSPTRRELGRDHGLYTIPGNFDDPLPEEIIIAFES